MTPTVSGERPHRDTLGPLKIHGPNDTVLAFFGMFATFDTPFEINASELALELLFPADEATAEVLKQPAQPDGPGD
jgi:hypothetical protein